MGSIMVLGGGGYVGAEVAYALAPAKDLSEILVADIDHVRSEAVVESLGDRRFKAVKLDITDKRAAVELMREVDVVMNCLFFGMFDYAIDAACEARVNYADLISEPTQQQLLKAEEAGITAISGLGFSPGLTNVLAKKGAKQLDQTDAIQISFGSLRDIYVTPGLLGTTTWELAPGCPSRGYHLNGEFIRTKPFEGSRMVVFPEPVGEMEVYYVSHTETVTLPKHIKGVKYVAVRGTWPSDQMNALRGAIKLGLLDDRAITYKGLEINVFDFANAAIWATHEGKKEKRGGPAFVKVEVQGKKQGMPTDITYDITHPVDWGINGLARSTAIPAAVGAIILARRGRTITGIVDPEEYYDPDEFLVELNSRQALIVNEEITVGRPGQR